MQNLDNKDKILKIFSKVHCFNKDQLPRYVDGRLTHVEKHLLEQHLVNCELCSDAVEILQKPKFKTQYQQMGLRVQQFIRSSTCIAPVHEAERYQKNIQIKESFLAYFWGAVAAALVFVCFYLALQEDKKEPMQNSFAKVDRTEPDHNESTFAASLFSIIPADRTRTTSSIQAETAQTKEAGKAETPYIAITNENSAPDKFLYKTAMVYYHQGNLDEAMLRFTQLITDTTSSYRELAHYQLAMCFKYKRQRAKARHMFTALVNMNGRLKKRALLALNRL